MCCGQELYKGVKKKLRVTRHIVDGPSGKSVPVQEVLEIDVKAGWKNGTRITYAGKGDEHPGQPASDLIFVVHEQPHARFRRQGHDLHTKVQVSITEGG